MTDDINDIRHTSTLAKFEDAVRRDERSSPDIVLLPCPFCGGTPYGTPSGHPGWVIRCGDCSVRTVSDYGRHEAEKEWNTRVSIIEKMLDADEIERLQTENWQLKQACGYPIPADKETPQNPFKCGICDARALDEAATPSDGAIYAAVSQRSVTPEEDALLRQALIASTEKLYDIPVLAQPSREMAAAYRIEHDGFEGVEIGSYVTLEGKRGVVLQQVGTRVVHVYGRKWLSPQQRAKDISK